MTKVTMCIISGIMVLAFCYDQFGWTGMLLGIPLCFMLGIVA
jgi:uncharacterized membrane protein YdcZ (DUF606 family)